MKTVSILALSLLCLGIAVPGLRAQRDQQQDVLTEAEQNKIEEAGIDADARIGLYAKYVGERADRVRRLGGRSESGMGRAMDRELENLASLVDELSSNLDEYGGRMADIRHSLQTLDKAIPHWQEVVKNLPKNDVYQISLDDATAALKDLGDQTRQLTAKEDGFFKAHKDAKGQQYEEPK